MHRKAPEYLKVMFALFMVYFTTWTLIQKSLKLFIIIPCRVFILLNTYINNLPLSRLVSYCEGAWRNPASGRPVTQSKYHIHYLLVMVTALPLQPSLFHCSYLSIPLPPTSFCCSVSVHPSSFSSHFNVLYPEHHSVFCLTLPFLLPSFRFGLLESFFYNTVRCVTEWLMYSLKASQDSTVKEEL